MTPTLIDKFQRLQAQGCESITIDSIITIIKEHTPAHADVDTALVQARRAIQCLYLECPGNVAADVSHKVEAAFTAMECIQSPLFCKQAEGECIQTSEGSGVQREIPITLREQLIKAIGLDQGWEESAVHMTDKVVLPVIFPYLRTEPVTVSLEKFTLTGEQIIAVHKRWMDAGCPGSILVDSANEQGVGIYVGD